MKVKKIKNIGLEVFKTLNDLNLFYTKELFKNYFHDTQTIKFKRKFSQIYKMQYPKSKKSRAAHFKVFTTRIKE